MTIPDSLRVTLTHKHYDRIEINLHEDGQRLTLTAYFEDMEVFTRTFWAKAGDRIIMRNLWGIFQ